MRSPSTPDTVHRTAAAAPDGLAHSPAEQVLREAIEAIDEAFVLYDPDDRLVTCNEKFRQLYALSRDLLQPGMRFEDVIRIGAERGQYAEAVGRVEEWVTQRMALHRAADTPHMQTLDDGRVMRIVERRTPDGHLVGFRFDITDLVRAREAAELAAREKSLFIATVSHELRTPLQAVLGFSELGAAFAESDPQYAPMFAEILAGGRRMLALVNGLLDVARPDGVKLVIQPRRIALGPLLDDVARELKPLSDARAVTIDRPHEAACPQVYADPLRLQQALRNVLANALRFTAERSQVSVDVADLGDEGVRIDVRDHGPGVDEDELERIFEPFVQSRRTRDGAGGTGLGLSICRRVLDAHGGSIVACLPPGGGTQFTIRLPAGPAVTPGPSQGAAHPPAMAGAGA